MNKYYVSRDNLFGVYFERENDDEAMRTAENIAKLKGWDKVAKHWRVRNLTTHRGVMSVSYCRMKEIPWL